jgi:dTDP-4-dehydrorhamnose reductase
LGERVIVARLSLVVGLPILGAGNSFLARMIAAFKEGRTVAVPEREVRTPVDVLTVGKALLELAGSGHHGILHLAGRDRLNRLEMARRIAARFGYPEQLAVAQSTATSPGRAPRPRDVSLDNAKACAMLRTQMLSFDEALSLILKTSGSPSL